MMPRQNADEKHTLDFDLCDTDFKEEWALLREKSSKLASERLRRKGGGKR